MREMLVVARMKVGLGESPKTDLAGRALRDHKNETNDSNEKDEANVIGDDDIGRELPKWATS